MINKIKLSGDVSAAMSVQAGVRCLSVLALLSGAALSDVGVASYPRWSDTRFPGAIVFSEQVRMKINSALTFSCSNVVY